MSGKSYRLADWRQDGDHLRGGMDEQGTGDPVKRCIGVKAEVIIHRFSVSLLL